MRRITVRLMHWLTVAGSAVLLAVAAAGPASAAAGPAGPDPTARLNTILTNATVWLMAILAAVATLCATVGGVRYVLAGGDPGEVEKAKSAFRSAGLGYALAALAPLVVQILKG